MLNASKYDLYRRGTIYYVRFYNPNTGKRCAGLSTGESSIGAAHAIAHKWLENGIPSKSPETTKTVASTLGLSSTLDLIKLKKLSHQEVEKLCRELLESGYLTSYTLKDTKADTTLLAFLRDFWNYNTSPYVKELHSLRRSIGRDHCKTMLIHSNRVLEYFGEDKKLGSLTRADIEGMIQYFGHNTELAGRTIKLITQVVTIATRWAFEKGLIPQNPGQGIRHFSSQHNKKQRGILSPEEAQELLSHPEYFSDYRSYLASLVACTTGLRAGEIQALQVQDVTDGWLYVRHSWSGGDGLKCTKTGEERKVPLLTSIREKLMELIGENPYGAAPYDYIFYSAQREKPMHESKLGLALDMALLVMKHGPEVRSYTQKKQRELLKSFKDRGVCFHSWRHFYASTLADSLDAEKVMRATGHKTRAVFNVYGAHASDKALEEVRSKTGEAFAGIA